MEKVWSMAKLKRLDELERRDWQTILEHCAPQEERCIGGRLIVPGIVCIHCDSQDPSTVCHETADEKTKPYKKPDYSGLTL